LKITLFIFGLLLSFIQVEAEVHPLFAAANEQYQQRQYDSALVLFNQLIQEFPERKEGYFNADFVFTKLSNTVKPFSTWAPACKWTRFFRWRVCSRLFVCNKAETCTKPCRHSKKFRAMKPASFQSKSD
jgi:hypothetical protein